MEVRSKVWLEKDGELVFGKGKGLIFRAVEETGSINKAAQKLGMSYRHAWSYIRSSEKRLGKSLVLKARGGENGGGAVLTDYAKQLLIKFECFEQDIQEYVDKRYKEVF
ncbi:MAG: winged helix-turn-helix domain-containing protein [Candidatus Omnitrophica bacterium]|nr:winged helix-turn-helix domain-containing protein [Candidatus Omnitrophota bacterium]